MVPRVEKSVSVVHPKTVVVTAGIRKCDEQIVSLRVPSHSDAAEIKEVTRAIQLQAASVVISLSDIQRFRCIKSAPCQIWMTQRQRKT